MYAGRLEDAHVNRLTDGECSVTRVVNIMLSGQAIISMLFGEWLQAWVLLDCHCWFCFCRFIFHYIGCTRFDYIVT